MRKLILDAGHSEKPKSFSREDEIDLIICNKIQRIVLDETKAGDERDIVSVVIPVRYTDGRLLDLMEKVRFANTIGADAYISIHCNWSDSNRTANGFNIYFDDKPNALQAQSKRLADIVAGQLTKSGLTPWGVPVDIDTHTGPGNLAVCSYTKMPAILIELGFLSSEKDAAELERAEIQDKIARAIYQGAHNFFI